jgi:hypothetical protein
MVKLVNPQWTGTNCYEQWIGPLVLSEIQIYQAISFASLLTKQMKMN